MNENTKKGILIAVIVIAVVGAIFGVTKATAGDKPEVVGHIPAPPGFKSERELDLERLKAQQNGTAAPTPAAGGEKDLGGDLGGH